MTKKLFVLFLIAFSSCKREKILDVYPDFQGNWRHNDDNNHFHYLSIQPNGYGYIEYYVDNKFDRDTQPRKWFIKNNVLIFGRTTGKDERFRIDQLPTISTTSFISGCDTVLIGQKYAILNGVVYVD